MCALALCKRPSPRGTPCKKTDPVFHKPFVFRGRRCRQITVAREICTSRRGKRLTRDRMRNQHIMCAACWCIRFGTGLCQALMGEDHFHNRLSSKQDINISKGAVHMLLGIVKKSFLPICVFVPIWSETRPETALCSYFPQYWRFARFIAMGLHNYDRPNQS